jgi:hypothetical protein
MSSITLRNNTNFVAQYVVKKGQQVIARLPGIAPTAQMIVPIELNFEVMATTEIDGNTYTSAPMEVQGGISFLAQVLQVPAQGTYTFEVQEMPSQRPSTLEFQKTCLGPVTFTLTKGGKSLQNVVVVDSFRTVTLDAGNTFYIYAVINGITTATTKFTNPSTIVTAVNDTSDLESGYFTLNLN